MNMSTGYKVKDILKISVPILIEDVLRTLMGTVNTFTLSRVSDSASAAVGVTNQILNVVLLVSVMMSAGVGIIENQAIGAGDERESSRIMMNSLTLAALFGVVCSSLTRKDPHQALALPDRDIAQTQRRHGGPWAGE